VFAGALNSRHTHTHEHTPEVSECGARAFTHTHPCICGERKGMHAQRNKQLRSSSHLRSPGRRKGPRPKIKQTAAIQNTTHTRSRRRRRLIKWAQIGKRISLSLSLSLSGVSKQNKAYVYARCLLLNPDVGPPPAKVWGASDIRRPEEHLLLSSRVHILHRLSPPWLSQILVFAAVKEHHHPHTPIPLCV
jgi:hypothetical protein